MADNSQMQVEVILKAQNLLSGELKKVSEDMKKMQDDTKKAASEMGSAFSGSRGPIAGVKTLGNTLTDFANKNKETFQNMSIAGGLAFAGITAAAYRGLKAYQEVERSNRQLEHAIVGVSKGTQEQVKQVQALTTALEKKAGVDSDSLNMGVAQLSTFGLQTKSVINLTKSLADLTVNQSGLNATSGDYISSANTIAKALNGQFGELTRMGIRFTETQQKIIEFGTESEKVKAIQEGLAQNLRETTDTVDGLDLSMAKSQRNMENISESIGQGLAPAFAMLTANISPIIGKIADWSSKNPELVGGIILATGAIVGLIAILGTLGLAITTVTPVITAMGGAITLLGGPISILIASIGVLAYTIYSNRDGIKQGTADFVEAMGIYWDAMKTNLETIAMQIKNNVGEILIRGMLALITAGMSEIFIARAGGWDKVVRYVYSVIEPMVTRVSSKLDAVRGFVSSISSALQTAKDMVGGGISSVTNIIQGERALGGPVSGGSTYMVGERGPELFVPQSSGHIVPNGKIGNNQSISINLYGTTIREMADIDIMAELLAKKIQSYTNFNLT